MKRTQATVTAEKPKTPARSPAQARTPKPAPKPAPVILAAVTSMAGGYVWRMSGRHGVAYVRNAALAGEILATDPRNLAKVAMAVYYDRKGKAFAWQVRFDTERWDEVVRRVGM